MITSPLITWDLFAKASKFTLSRYIDFFISSKLYPHTNHTIISWVSFTNTSINVSSFSARLAIVPLTTTTASLASCIIALLIVPPKFSLTLHTNSHQLGQQYHSYTNSSTLWRKHSLNNWSFWTIICHLQAAKDLHITFVRIRDKKHRWIKKASDLAKIDTKIELDLDYLIDRFSLVTSVYNNIRWINNTKSF